MRLAQARLSAVVQVVLAVLPACSAIRPGISDPVAVRYEAAEAARREGRADEALAGFRAALAADPAYEAAHRGYQDVLLAQGKGETLRAEYAQLAERLGEPWCQELYGRVLFDPVREEELYRSALEREPDSLSMLKALSSALERQLRFEEAAAVDRRRIALAPHDVEAHRSLLAQELRLGRGDEALAEYRGLLLQDPGSAVAHLALAYALSRRSEHEQAAAHLSHAQEVAPRMRETRRARLVLAVRREDRKEFDSALRACLEADPADADVLTIAGGYLVRQEADSDRGADMLREAERLAPTGSAALARLGWMHLNKDELLEAEPLLDEALRRNPVDTVALVGKAWLASVRKQLDEARALYEQSRAIDDSPAIRRRLFYFYQRNEIQLLEEAVELLDSPPGFEGLAARDPNERAIDRLKAVRLYLGLGRSDDAWELVSAEIGSEDCHPTVLGAAAEMLERRGDCAGASTLVEHAVARGEGVEPEDRARLQAQWARVLLKTGRREEACQAYRDLWVKHSLHTPFGLDVAELIDTLDETSPEAGFGMLPDAVPARWHGKDSCLADATVAMLELVGKHVDPSVLTPLLERRQLSESLWLLNGFNGFAAIPFLVDRTGLQRLVGMGFPPLVTMVLSHRGRVGGHAALAVGYDDRLGVVLLVDGGTLADAGVVAYGTVEGERGIALLPAELAEEAETWLPGVEYCRLLHQAEQHFARKEWDTGHEVVDRALALNPGSPHAHRLLVEGNNLQGDPQDPGPMLELLCSLPGASAVDFCKYGSFDRSEGDKVGARRALGEAISRFPGYLDAWRHLLAVAAEEKASPEEIQRPADKVLELERFDVAALYWRGYALLWKGDATGAARDLELSLGLDASQDGWWWLATAREMSGDLQGALSALEQYERRLFDLGTRREDLKKICEWIEGLRAKLAESPEGVTPRN